MVKISDDIVVFIGGAYAITNTILVNISDDFSIVKGPPMLQSRYYHSCGSFNLDGKLMVVVTGGYDGSDVISTELWDPESNDGFIAGIFQVVSIFITCFRFICVFKLFGCVYDLLQKSHLLSLISS